MHELEAVVFTTWVSLVGVVGVVGNALIVARYPVFSATAAIGFLIKALAVTDLLNCVLVPYTVLFELSLVQSEVVCKAMELVRHVVTSMSVLLLALVAIEKYFLICQPLRMLQRATYIRIIIALLVYCALCNIPVLLLATTRRAEGDLQNRKYFDLGLATCYVDTSMSAASSSHAVLGLVSYWGAVVVMVVSYAFILRALRERNQRKPTSAESSSFP